LNDSPDLYNLIDSKTVYFVKSYFKKKYLLFILLIPFSLYSQVKNSLTKDHYQKLFEQIQNQYGPDQTLLNGIFYQYPYRNL